MRFFLLSGFCHCFSSEKCLMLVFHAINQLFSSQSSEIIELTALCGYICWWSTQSTFQRWPSYWIKLFICGIHSERIRFNSRLSFWSHQNEIVCFGKRETPSGIVPSVNWSNWDFHSIRLSRQTFFSRINNAIKVSQSFFLLFSCEFNNRPLHFSRLIC